MASPMTLLPKPRFHVDQLAGHVRCSACLPYPRSRCPRPFRPESGSGCAVCSRTASCTFSKCILSLHQSCAHLLRIKRAPRGCRPIAARFIIRPCIEVYPNPANLSIVRRNRFDCACAHPLRPMLRKLVDQKPFCVHRPVHLLKGRASTTGNVRTPQSAPSGLQIIPCDMRAGNGFRNQCARQGWFPKGKPSRFATAAFQCIGMLRRSEGNNPFSQCAARKIREDFRRTQHFSAMKRREADFHHLFTECRESKAPSPASACPFVPADRTR